MSTKKSRPKAFLVIAMAMTLMLVSCEPQVVLFPLYTVKDLVTDDNLVGTWVDEHGDAYTFERSPHMTGYLLTYGMESDVILQSDVHLLRLGGYLFVDLVAHHWSDEEKAKGLKVPYPFLPMHTFGRIQIDPAGTYVSMALLDDNWVRKQQEEHTLGLDVLTPGYDEPDLFGSGQMSAIVVSPTEKLQEFALQHAEDKKAFSFERALCRQGHDCNNLGQ
jgi:hypothetical protein